MLLGFFSVEPSSVCVEPASTAPVTVTLGVASNSPGVAFYRVTEKSGKSCQAEASATPVKCEISSLPYIKLLNFLIILLIMFALDHLSYLLDSYLCSDWFTMYSYPI